MTLLRASVGGAIFGVAGLATACHPTPKAERPSAAREVSKPAAVSVAPTTVATDSTRPFEAAVVRREPGPPATIELERPSLDDWSPRLARRAPKIVGEDFTHVATVKVFRVDLVDRPGSRYDRGLAHRGARLLAVPDGGHCSGGSWYKVQGGAYLCADGDDVEVTERKDTGRPVRIDTGIPIHRPLPFGYAKAEDGAPRVTRPLTPEESSAVDKGRKPPSLERWMNGTYLLALRGAVEDKGVKMFKTAAGYFVRAEDLTPKPTPETRGVRLGGSWTLPIAFAVEDAELYCEDDGDERRDCGDIERHARVELEAEKAGDDGFLRTEGGREISIDSVRIAAPIERPDQVGPKDKWIHVNLSEQTLVAYRGDRPVYATIVSTGKPGHDTQPGLFQVERKYLSKTMRGYDENGLYAVGEVPWTMYYEGKFALHGAYWHENFGNTRSHGCINIPPVDARWLFFWDSAKLPPGWYAARDVEGAHVYVTGKTPAKPKGDGA